MADFPLLARVASVDFKLVGNTQLDRSPLSGAVQAKNLPGSIWRANVAIDRHKLDDLIVANVEQFLNGLQGSGGTFQLWPHHRSVPNGTPTGSPLVAGASQIGKSLNTDAWGLNDTGVLLPGDFFEVNGELKQIDAQIDSDGAGLATLTYHPELRVSPPNNDPIITTRPTGTFRLVSDDGFSMLAQRKVEVIRFTAEESFGP